jgi:hypothetical protein
MDLVASLRWVVASVALGFFAVGAGRAEVSWEPTIYPDDQIFPSLILSTARLRYPEEVLGEWTQPHVGDVVGLIGVELAGVAKGAEVEVRVKPNKFIEGGSIRATILREEDGWTIHPKVNYNFDALAANTQPRPANVTVEVRVDGRSLGERTTTVEETTVIGAEVAASEPSEWIGDAVREVGAAFDSWDSFETAVEIASNDLDEHGEEFVDVENFQYELVDIAAARELGIQPIGGVTGGE